MSKDEVKTLPAKPVGFEDYDIASVEYAGKTYWLRELSVDEGDDIDTACTDEKGVYNGKLSMRMSFATAAFEPLVTVDEIGKWPAKKYVTFARVFNRLNTLRMVGDTGDGKTGETAPNATSPAG